MKMPSAKGGRTRKLGTRTRLRPALRRRQLLDAAAQIILIEGQGALTMDRLARQAGVSIGLVYHHFGNRAGLLMALFEMYWEENDRKSSEVQEEGLSPEEYVRRMFHVYLLVRHRYPALWRLQAERSVEPEVEVARLARARKRTAEWATYFVDNFNLSVTSAKMAVGMVFGSLRAGLDFYFTDGGDLEQVELLGVAFATAGLQRFCEQRPRMDAVSPPGANTGEEADSASRPKKSRSRSLT